ncbi:unnamed protein product [Diatraea saccharalis]|uniref:Uncharacterized protein n=1 Tax=Diatraea saccharalis TaxID=40085 RepID=A0A9N9RG41_9NEOP|nr:unnamed protein product [Diatraea saccharalis]
MNLLVEHQLVLSHHCSTIPKAQELRHIEMNLVLIAALVAVCGAAKLDRTYLPPPSAKTAGGSAGSLQTPFASNSFNQGLGGLPKGSFTNEFQGVVVDAAAPGTRTSEGETGLGAPRPTYGSTNSKVGDAAFRGTAGFRLPTTQAIEEEHLDSDVQAANAQLSGLSQGFGANARFEAKPERAQAAYDRAANVIQLENEVGSDAYRYSFETDNGISASENGVATNGVQAQGGYSYTGDDGQVYSVTYTADEGGYQPKGDHLPTPPPIPVEILKSLEQNARDEAAGLNDDGTYDAQKYNAGADYSESDITNVEQNDKSAPSFSRQPATDATASGSFISQNNQAFVKPSAFETNSQKYGTLNSQESLNNAFGSSNSNNRFSHDSQSNHLQSNRFGSRNEFSPSISGLQQNGKTPRPVNLPVNNNQPLSGGMDRNLQFSAPQELEKNIKKPSGGLNRNTFMLQGSTYDEKPSKSNGFEPTSSSMSSSVAANFGLNSGNRFSSRNEYLPPVQGSFRPQRPLSSADSTLEPNFNQISETGNIQATSEVSLGTTANVKEPQSFNSFSQKPQSLNNEFSKNVNSYPVKKEKETDDEQNITSFETQRPTSVPSIELTTPLESSETQNNLNKPSNHEVPSISTKHFNVRPSSQFGSQSNDRQLAHSLPNTETLVTNTHFPARDQNQHPSSTSNQRPSKNGSNRENMPNEQTFNVHLSQFESHSSNIQSAHPLSNAQSQVSNTDFPARDQSQYSSSSGNQKPSQYGANLGTLPENISNGQNFNVPTSQFGNQLSNQEPTRTLSNTQTQASNIGFPSENQNRYSSLTGNPQPSQNGFAQNQLSDAQYSPSTVRPVYNQQPQRAVNSYYYKQPVKPFNTPTTSSSRIPSSPSGQSNRIFQQSQPQFSENPQATLPITSFQPQNKQPTRGNTRYPEPPTLASAAPTASINSQFQGSTTSSQYNGITQAAVSPFQPQNGQASSKYPRPPTLAPTVATTPFGGFPSQQTTASAFASGTPTAPTFGARPTFQSQYSQQNQIHSSPEQSFGQRYPQTLSEKDQGDNSQTSPPQQYSGEIYEYNKPSERLPAPAKPGSTSSPHRGQPQPQFGQTQESSQELNTQQPTRPIFGTRPQFGSPLQQRPQFSQGTSQNTNDQPAADSKSQFNVQSRPYGSNQQQEPLDSVRPQFGQNNGKLNNCCQSQSLDAQITKLESQRPQSNNRGSTRPQFAQSESQFSGPVSQISSQSVAGRGEVFGGPRKPPSFDQETGYHY